MQDDGVFDEAVAQAYDALHAGNPEDTQRAVELLEELAGGGACLEFAVGTGRIALPLKERGVTISGVELSQAMVDQLRRKERGDPMQIVIGDMTTTRLPRSFSLVFLVFNTIDNLTTQDAQIACFQNAADHLLPGGAFLVETLIPPLQTIPFGQTRLAFDNSPGHMGVDEFDLVTQQYVSHHIWVEHGQARQLSVPFRYAWPAELDLMARMAGLEFESRWEDWDRAAFTHTSEKHISVWRKPA